MIRIVGLSATLPNFKDVAVFLGVNLQRGLFVFDSSYRPTPLEQVFIGVREKRPNRQNEAFNEAVLDRCLPGARPNSSPGLWSCCYALFPPARLPENPRAMKVAEYNIISIHYR
jgi:hypothetical protein